MRFDILTLFPEMFGHYLTSSMMEKARSLHLLEVRLHNIRDHAVGKHRITDEPPYGGGGGMVLKPEPIFSAVEAIFERDTGEKGVKGNIEDFDGPIILLSPQGRPFSQKIARELAGHDRLVLICGRYEGVDERVREHLVTDELSIGDFVLTGGELAAMVIVDAVTRLVPGVLGATGADLDDSFARGLLEGPHYTRPHSFRGWEVPDVLRSGNAAEVSLWKRKQALRRTWTRRPELLLEADLSEEDRYYLMVLAEERAAELGN